MSNTENQDATAHLRDDEDSDLLRSDLVTTPDNTTISEELSRFSSSPSRSHSSSCTSITNPFYDGFNLPSGSRSVAMETARQELALSDECQNLSPVVSSSDILHERGDQEEEEEEEERARGAMQRHSRLQQRVIIVWNFGYLLTCAGFLQVLQVAMSVVTLSCLTSAGAEEGGLLNLPLSWHFRIMIFILVLTLLVTMTTLLGHLTSLIALAGFEWICFDMVLYSLFAFLLLVGSSLVASAFDFYQKMKTDVSTETINQLVTAVVLGYVLMVLHGLTAALSYQRWKIQYKLYQRRKLIEEDEIDL